MLVLQDCVPAPAASQDEKYQTPPVAQPGESGGEGGEGESLSLAGVFGDC